MREIYRILDANFNRTRESLRAIEDCGRFVLNDPAITAMAKTFRSDVRQVLEHLLTNDMVSARNPGGDIGTVLTSPTENVRDGIGDIASAACKRLTEALRTLEEYSKMICPGQTSTLERMRYNAYTLEQMVVSRLLVADRFRKIRLYTLVSAKLCQSHCLVDVARQTIAGGAEAIQLREKDTPDDIFLAMAAELRELADETSRLLIINDRVDIAAIVGADGVHLGQNDLPINEARRILRPGSIIGRSTHSARQAREAINEGADYIAIGPMYESRTKDHEVVGPEVLSEVIEAMKDSNIPVVAIGGIDEKNVVELIERGVNCVAVCSAINCADDPKAATQHFLSLMDKPEEE